MATAANTATGSSKRKSISARKKSVRFSETSSLIVTRSKSRDELKSLWHSRRELKELKQNVTCSVRRILSTHPSAAKAYIKKSLGDITVTEASIDEFVGIEHVLSSQVCNALCLARSKSIRDVLEEQKRQQKLGIRDEGALAEVSRKCSQFPRRWRYRIAQMSSAEEDKAIIL